MKTKTVIVLVIIMVIVGILTKEKQSPSPAYFSEQLVFTEPMTLDIGCNQPAYPQLFIK